MASYILLHALRFVIHELVFEERIRNFPRSDKRFMIACLCLAYFFAFSSCSFCIEHIFLLL